MSRPISAQTPHVEIYKAIFRVIGIHLIEYTFEACTKLYRATGIPS